LHIAWEIFKRLEEHLLLDDKPSEFLSSEAEEAAYFDRHPFTMLKKLKDIPQSPEHHPEGNVWNHTLLVVDEAAKRKNESEDKRAFMWAALLHDIGKAPATRVKKGRIVAYDHDKIGEKMAVEFLEALTDDKELIDKVSKLVRWHMQILFVVKDLPFADLGNMMKQVSYKEIALLGICDRLGRGELTEERIQKEKDTVELFIRKCEERLNVFNH
jgi:tRNA nucleotidyltransferase (CCA-adding enzyme)